MNVKRRIERLPARQCYGTHAVGSVVLVNELICYHGTPGDATKFMNHLLKMPGSVRSNVFQSFCRWRRQGFK